VPPVDIVLVQAGSLPKTSSGKLQRSLCRQRYLDDQLDLV
jgi:fatty-acyl-CoA synthase